MAEQLTAHVPAQVGRGPRLVRRLLIRCPVAGTSADTGFELHALAQLRHRRHLLVDCLECGQDHEWTVDDVFVD